MATRGMVTGASIAFLGRYFAATVTSLKVMGRYSKRMGACSSEVG
ncbi:hypothetical protein AB1K81_18275 [Ornithinibacillus sp. 179-J 7C1 HS]